MALLWKEIKEKYPKAFSLLDKSVDIHWELEPERYQRLRFLYDFFDEQMLYIEISVWHVDKEKEFRYEIQDKYSSHPYILQKCSPINVSHPFKNRIEAEEQAFLKAFEILEKKKFGLILIRDYFD